MKLDALVNNGDMKQNLLAEAGRCAGGAGNSLLMLRGYS